MSISIEAEDPIRNTLCLTIVMRKDGMSVSRQPYTIASRKAGGYVWVVELANEKIAGSSVDVLCSMLEDRLFASAKGGV